VDQRLLAAMAILAIDHVQLAMPAGQEQAARDFYGGLLDIPEVPKPPELAARGGAWFESGDVKIHLGVEVDFRPARKAHPALIVQDLPTLIPRLREAGIEIIEDDLLPGYDRIYLNDPFGNRLELLEPQMPAPSKDLLQPVDDAARSRLGALVADHRQAVLATLDSESAPYTAMTAYVHQPEAGGFLIHLSELSAHKRQLRANPRCSLMIFEPDDGQGEVLQRCRLSLSCQARLLPKDGPDYATAQLAYLERLPGHAMMFGLGDFDLFLLEPQGGLMNAGFGRAYAITPADFAARVGT
jgi:catechol 2,3-dioxygenase-like lactoylglutathione lyase family enzyme